MNSSRMNCMNSPRSKHSACTDGRFLYVTGSKSLRKNNFKNNDKNKEALKALIPQIAEKNEYIGRSVERFDPINNFWQLLPSMQ